MGTNSLNIRFCNSVAEAPTYMRPEYEGAELIETVLVKNGTEGGMPTIDLIFRDSKGQKYIAMITSRLLEQVVGK